MQVRFIRGVDIKLCDIIRFQKKFWIAETLRDGFIIECDEKGRLPRVDYKCETKLLLNEDIVAVVGRLNHSSI